MHTVNGQMTKTVNIQRAAVLHYSLHGISMPYFIMFPKYLTQIIKLHVLKDEGSGVSISWGKTFQLAFEIHLKITVRRHNLKGKTNFKVIKTS